MKQQNVGQWKNTLFWQASIAGFIQALNTEMLSWGDTKTSHSSEICRPEGGEVDEQSKAPQLDKI